MGIIKKSTVPKNTIAVYTDEFSKGVTLDKLDKIIGKPSRKRDWFEPHFYNCLPLAIGNQYGFVITAEFDFTVIWTGGNSQEDIIVTGVFPDSDNGYPLPDIVSHFGYGTVSIVTPFLFRTPKGVNLITVNPPNHLMKNLTVLTGIVETDQSRMPFTFNWKIHEPNVIMHFPKGTPLAGFFPVQRMYAENFKIEHAFDVMTNKQWLDDMQQFNDHAGNRDYRQEAFKDLEQRDGLYFKGTDVYGNKFHEHQNQSASLDIRE